MVLPAPVLDDRSYDELITELRGRIPVYTSEWTDLGASDPGITLLELFAFLGENLLYRFNQIPDATRMWLLRLLQVPPRPARSSRGLVAFSPRSPTSTIAAVVEKGSSVRAGAVPFEVGQDVAVVPLDVKVAVKTAAATPTDPELVQSVERSLDARDGLADDEQPQFYETNVLDPDPAAPGFQPLDVSAAVDRCLWIAVFSTGADPAELVKPTGPLGTNVLNLGVGVDAEFPTIDDVDPCDGLDAPAEHARVSRAAAAAAAHSGNCALSPELPAGDTAQGPARAEPPLLYWEVSTVLVDDAGEPEYREVTVEGDTTHGLTRDGVVVLRLPEGLLGVGVVPLADPDRAGTGALPPPVDDDRPVLFWLRAFPREGVPDIGRLRWVGFNAADVEQVAQAVPEFVGVGNGMPHQEFALAHGSVVPDSLELEVEENGAWVEWQRVVSFAASGRADRHYTLDAVAGRVRGGDTVRGRAFQIDQRIRVRGYSYGGGRQGNVAAKAVSKVEANVDVTAANPLPLRGGEEAETIAEALERIPGEFGRHDRAVTSSDFRELASITGVGRAECLARFHPPMRMWEAAGVVSVVVWPTEDPKHPDAPVPDDSLLRAVCRQLDARRLVTTELYVIPPTYRKVAVSVGLAVKQGYSAAAVRRWVELVLRQYLAPLPPYGPEGHGWPLGHRVYGPELEAAVLQVEGVDFLEGLEVAGQAGDGTWPPGTVELEGWEVVELSELSVVVGPPPPPGEGVPPPPAPKLVPIPVPKDEC